jgi:WD40 repeat protein
MKKLLSLISLLFLIGVNVFAQSHISSQAHQAAISMISSGNIEDGFENIYFSAGKDGFLVKWTDDNNGEHYQITELEIKMISVSPNGKEIAVYETDGGLINRVSVWNWETLTRKFARRFSDSVTSISYTANGNYIMVGTATVDGVVFLRSSNGDVVSNKIRESTGIVSYAITSKTEKTAVMYSPAGSLAYYNLFTGRLTKKFNVEQGLSNTVLFNNYLFLAGIKDGMIYIVYALSGKTLATIPAPNTTILATPTDSNLYYLETDNRGNYH